MSGALYRPPRKLSGRRRRLRLTLKLPSTTRKWTPRLRPKLKPVFWCPRRTTPPTSSSLTIRTWCGNVCGTIVTISLRTCTIVSSTRLQTVRQADTYMRRSLRFLLARWSINVSGVDVLVSRNHSPPSRRVLDWHVM
uniref:Uncharacterized protein n=1 Tax=Cacopsylla melanoneura TaxID=428564 RepID=A0A8D8RL31_9HEMI